MSKALRAYLENYKIHIALFVFGLIIFSLPAVLRFYFYGITDIAGFPTYLHTRMAGYIIDSSFNFYDPLSFGGRAYLYPPLFSYVLAAFGFLFGLKLGGVVFVSVFGGLGLVAFYMIAKEFISRKRAALASVVLALIPGTIFLYSHVSTRAVPITIALFALYFIIRDHKKYCRHAAVLLGVAALFHPEVPLVFGIIILLYFISKNYNLKNFLRMAAITAVIALLWYVPLVFANGLPTVNDLHTEYRERRYSLESPSLSNYLWEVEVNGERKGYLNLLVGIFSVIGFVSAASDKSRKLLAYWLIFAMLMTLAFERLFVYMPFIAVLLAVIGLGTFSKERYYRILIIILVVYTAFFAASRINAMATDWPTQNQIDAMLWIKENTPNDSVVLSDWQWGHWVTGIAQRKNFMDGFAEYAPDVNERLAALNEFYRTCKVPQGYGVGYVYMEDWWVRQNNINCIFNFQLVYNSSYLYVFKV